MILLPISLCLMFYVESYKLIRNAILGNIFYRIFLTGYSLVKNVVKMVYEVFTQGLQLS